VLSSSSEDEVYDSGEESDNYNQEAFEDLSDEEDKLPKTAEGLKIKQSIIQAKIIEYCNMIENRRNEIIGRVGTDLYNDFYQFFKSKVVSNDELSE